MLTKYLFSTTLYIFKTRQQSKSVMSCSNHLSYFSYLDFVFWKRRDSNPRPRRDERSNTILRHLFIIKADKVKFGKGICALFRAPLLPILGGEPAILHLRETCVFFRKLLPGRFSTQLR